MFKDKVLPALTILLAVLVVAGFSALLQLALFQRDCVDAGGTFSIDGGTAHCRY